MKNGLITLPNHSGTTDKACKNYKKKKSMSMFVLVKDRENDGLKHIEMLRVVNRKDGEFYVLPTPNSGYDLHLSYHKSGQFHMAFNREHRFFLDDERDLSGAFRDYLWTQFASGWIQGFCFSVHKSVSKQSLERMLKILTAYVFIDLTSTAALADLFLKKRTTQFPPKPNRNIQDYPLATGFMVVVLKTDPDMLRTLNFTLVSDRPEPLIYRLKKKEQLIITPEGNNEIVEVSRDEIQSTVFAQM